MQPYHAVDDGRWAEKRLGADRARTTYAFRSLLDDKATLAFGSDWDVAPISPILGIAAAVTRRTIDGKNPNGWVPAQKITVEEALRAYTVSAAYAGFEEKEKGSLETGKLGDFVILAADPFSREARGPREDRGRHDGRRRTGRLLAVRERAGGPSSRPQAMLRARLRRPEPRRIYHRTRRQDDRVQVYDPKDEMIAPS